MRASARLLSASRFPLWEWITLLLQGPGPRSRTFWGEAMKSKLHPRFH